MCKIKRIYFLLMKQDKMEIPITANKHELKDILSSLMEECDVDDAQLARETGVPVSTLSRMRLNSNANPTAATLRPISKYFSISISQLLGDEPLPVDRLPGTQNPTYYTAARIPIIEWGWIDRWLCGDIDDIKSKLWNWISTEKSVGDQAFALIISTESFGIAFRKGSTVMIDPSQLPKDGDLVLIKSTHENNAMLKQYIKDGEDIYIRSVNPDIKSIHALDDKYQIVGIVVEVRFSLQESISSFSRKEASRSSLLSEHGFPKLA